MQVRLHDSLQGSGKLSQRACARLLLHSKAMKALPNSTAGGGVRSLGALSQRPSPRRRSSAICASPIPGGHARLFTSLANSFIKPTLIQSLTQLKWNDGDRSRPAKCNVHSAESRCDRLNLTIADMNSAFVTLASTRV